MLFGVKASEKECHRLAAWTRIFWVGLVAKYVKLLRTSFYVQLSACRPLSNYALIFNLKRKHNTTTTTTTQHIKGKQTKTLYY